MKRDVEAIEYRTDQARLTACLLLLLCRLFRLLRLPRLLLGHLCEWFERAVWDGVDEVDLLAADFEFDRRLLLGVAKLDDVIPPNLVVLDDHHPRTDHQLDLTRHRAVAAIVQQTSQSRAETGRAGSNQRTHACICFTTSVIKFGRSTSDLATFSAAPFELSTAVNA